MIHNILYENEIYLINTIQMISNYYLKIITIKEKKNGSLFSYVHNCCFFFFFKFSPTPSQIDYWRELFNYQKSPN